ncbi:MAG: hypothetical protein HKO59_01320, partial [Phycisphaerales bacterium]|nr:hypothetical protein [Phycisphaerales bacterium]
DFGREAVLWTADGRLERFADRLAAAGVDVTGWQLDRITGISTDGTVIVGHGLNPLGDREAWIATLPTPCAGDVDASGDVGFTDLIAVLDQWGVCPGCPADLDGDGVVGLTDLLAVLAGWGVCR